ncbi:MAG: hypothetical protein AAF990_02785 [Bacteroidota bacterium]
MNKLKKYSASLFVFLMFAMLYPFSVGAVISEKSVLKTERIDIRQKHKSRTVKKRRGRTKLWSRIKNRVQRRWFAKLSAAKGKVNKKIRIGLWLLGIGVASLLASNWIGISLVRLIAGGVALLGLILLILGLMDS